MSATGYTPIITYNSGTTTNVPLAANLASGELAINYADGKLFYKNSGGVVTVLAATAGTTSITTLGTVTTGTWNASVITGTYGGTGVNNGSNTITIAGNVTHSGAFTQTFTATANTSLTLPTSGTLISTVTNMANNPVTGTPSSSNFLRGDGTWATPSGTFPSPYTANGVVYASSTSALATGSGLTFDGSNLGVGGNPASTGIDTGVTRLFVVAPNSNTGMAATFIADSSGRGVLVADQGKTNSFGITISTGLVNIGSNTSGTNLAFNTSGTEKMRLTTAGYLGINTSSPTEPLNVFTSATATTAGSNVVSRFSSNGSGYDANITLGDNVNASARLGYLSGNMYFWTNGAERVRLSGAGGFSVGTTADPGAGAIYATGNITAYYSSDIKFKTNVQDIQDPLGIVTAIGSKTFDWTDEYLGTHGGEDEYFQPKQSFGVIAQDVQKVFPQAVRTRTDGSLAVDYEKLAILSFGAIGQLLKRVEALEAK